MEDVSNLSQRAEKVQRMFESIAHRYDLGNSVLSFGIHHYWRWRLLRLVANSESARALDVCTGTGDLLPLLKKKFGGQVVGVDFCYPMLANAKHKPVIKSNSVTLVQGDGLRLPFRDSEFDCITVAFGVRNFADLSTGLSELCRVLKPGGNLLILEFGQPVVPVFAGLYRWYSKTLMPKIGGFITGNQDAYTYLPETASSFPCGKLFEAELKKVGLNPQKTVVLTGGIAYGYQSIKV